MNIMCLINLLSIPLMTCGNNRLLTAYSRCVRGKVHPHMRGQGSLFLHLIATHGQGRSAIGLGEKC